jgi:hypothetical protein
MTWLPTGYVWLMLGIDAVAVFIIWAVGVLTRRPRATSRVSALKQLRGWHVVDDIAADAADVDHVVVAPAGVLAIVTEDHGDDREPAHDLHAAERAAAQVREFLRMRSAGDAVVVPVVWVNGAAAPDLVGGHRLVSGVHIVDGDDPGAWLHVFRDARLAGADRLRLCRELDASMASVPTVRALRATRPVPPPAADAA